MVCGATLNINRSATGVRPTLRSPLILSALCISVTVLRNSLFLSVQLLASLYGPPTALAHTLAAKVCTHSVTWSIARFPGHTGSIIKWNRFVSSRDTSTHLFILRLPITWTIYIIIQGHLSQMYLSYNTLSISDYVWVQVLYCYCFYFYSVSTFYFYFFTTIALKNLLSPSKRFLDRDYGNGLK